MEKYFKGKNILITGGTGSIGSEIARQVLKHDPNIIRIYSNDEDAQFRSSQEFGNKGKVRHLYGDIREVERLNTAMNGIDIVFHAAALKHVPACEYDPFEAVKTNVIGTQNVVRAALDKNVKKVINISTDKAVNPINVMGSTKLLAERIMSSANNIRGDKVTIFASVRFGNVLASRGSVLPIFLGQISKGGPVTITEPEMTRFVMSISQSVNLILKAADISRGGEIFILDMPALKIGDLADVMIGLYAKKYGWDPKQIAIEQIGIRPGEKYHEELMTHFELGSAVKNDGMYVVMPAMLDKKSNISLSDYNSSHASLLSKKDIRTLLEGLNEMNLETGLNEKK